MKKIVLSLLAIILLIEEWLWDLLSALGHYLVEKLGLIKFELWLAQTTPYQALFAISIPIILVTPLNIGAIWFFAQGLILQALLLEIIAKLLGTLFIARFFTLTKKQLLTFKLIAIIYNTITSWLRWAHQKIIETTIYKLAKTIKASAKAKLASWFKNKK